MKISKIEWENCRTFDINNNGTEDNNNGFIYGLEWEIGSGDYDVQWFKTEKERNIELRRMNNESN